MPATEYDDLRTDIRSIVEKIDKLMSREEYERRHSNLEVRVDKLEQDIRTMAAGGFKEHQDMRADVGRRFDKILEKFDELKTEVLHSRSDNFKWGLGIVISFMLGGGLVGTGIALHIIH